MTSASPPAFRVIVVLPAYNEEQGVGLLLPRLATVMRDGGLAHEIVVVDDGSTDATARIVDEHRASLPIRLERHPVNRGLGETIRDGLKAALERAADDDVIVVMDADNTHPPDLIVAMVESLRGGADVVIASRYRPGAGVHGVPVHRRMLSVGARLAFRLFFPIPGVRDYTCGYRGYRASLLRRAFQRHGDAFVDQRGFQCMADILLKLRGLDPVFREIPLVLRYDLKPGASKMKVARTIGQSLALLARRRLSR